MTEQTAITTAGFYLAPAAQLQTILQAYQLKKDFITNVLREKVDFGPIPGSDKPALLKPGAEKLNNLFSLYPTFDHVQVVEDWTGEAHGNEPFFHYHERANLWRIVNGERILVASADGSCNSWEKKYRYRSAERLCPNCGKAAIIKGKKEYGGGWICFDKKGGCKSKFADGDQAIEGQQLGQIKNPDAADIVNTVLKMAQKRALVAATLIATAASDYFTQDVDDFIDGSWHDAEPTPTPAQPTNGNGHARPNAMTWEAAMERKTPKGMRYAELNRQQLEMVVLKGKGDDVLAATLLLDNMDFTDTPPQPEEPAN